MKKKITIEFFLFFLLFFFLISITIFQGLKQDYTSIIDFDLTVIHNSLQLVSNEFPDFQDLTSYSHFLTYGIFYKIFSFFDDSLITNIELLSNNKNPELILKKLYVVSRIANATIHFVALVYFYKILKLFNTDKINRILILIFLVISETFIANFIILRTDIVAVCYFLISFFYLLDFVKNNKILNLFIVSFFMIFSLLAKVQIIFSFMFIFFFFIFYSVYERKFTNKINNDLFISGYLKNKIKYILPALIINYFLFQIYLNNFVNTSGVGYFDLFCFGIYFVFIFLTIYFISKVQKISQEYYYNIFGIILTFCILNVLILKIISLIGLLKINFNIIFSLTNPFYFLKIYSPLNNEFSFELIYEIFLVFFNQFNFNLIYSFLLLITFLLGLKNSFLKSQNENYKNNFYLVLFSLIVFFLILINNFRYNVSYNIYILPFLFLSICILLNSLKKKILYSIVLTSLFVINFTLNTENYKKYVYKPSNLDFVCINKSTRDFYYHWARNFNEDFFKKICLNSNLLFK